MCFFRIFLLFMTMLVVPLSANSFSPFYVKERMQLEIDFLKYAMEVRYAPRAWKETYYGWDLDKAAQEAKQRIANYPCPQLPLKEFQRIIRDFFHTFKDYHVGAFFYSTEEANLSFRIKGIEGKYYIAYIDREKLTQDTYSFEVGDELVLFDERPVSDCIEELLRDELRSVNKNTDYALAEEILTNRSGMDGHFVPRGSISITIRSAQTGQLQSYQMGWTYVPEKLSQCFQEMGIYKPTATFEKAFDVIFDQQMIFPRFDPLFSSKNDPSSPISPISNGYMMGNRHSYVPSLGNVHWQSEATSPFHACLFEMSDGHFVGYIRIPHYNGGAQEVEEFGSIMDLFQEHASAIVIDQVNNPGGSPMYLYALASTLTDRPLKVPMHRMAITYHEAAMAATMIPFFENVTCDADAQTILGADLRGIVVNYQVAQLFLNYLYFIQEQWKAGHSLTTPCAMYGIGQINPHLKHRYTKPILLLINSLDFSGGDFFPAILQDNQRAILLGESTAGAGGTYLRMNHLNIFGMRCYSTTTSLAERTNHQMLENIGVTPDIPYSLTHKDLRYQYSDYKEKIISTLQQMID